MALKTNTGVGKRIKERREQLNISQDELARRVGVKSKASISKVENGQDNITSERVEKFARALNCTAAYLMGWSDSPHSIFSDTAEAAVKSMDNSVMNSIIGKLGSLDDSQLMLVDQLVRQLAKNDI